MSSESRRKAVATAKANGTRAGDKQVARAQLQMEQVLTDIEQAYFAQKVTVPIFLRRLLSMRAMWNGLLKRIQLDISGYDSKTHSWRNKAE